MGHFGFSYIGLIFLIMITVPNIIWTKNLPEGYDYHNENKVLLAFERIGQILATTTAVIFNDYNINKISAWSFWLVLAFVMMILYECWWIRYFRSGRTLADFYSSFLNIPVAGATLPILGFLFLGIYGRVIWLIISVFILGVGHIGIHLQHKNEIIRR